ncbi:MAG: tRNA (adenosine(37)-N6)-threonylcarbamoyltransferase complex dimerization subunit type 1 TsaB [Legionellaceae bacterium]|nr:tRNA (adenosine(37)-N6)-threonylcarbamoyltransferase complex dimerization subunit type 1 TsaB [Legionellaceae bacterium]
MSLSTQNLLAIDTSTSHALVSLAVGEQFFHRQQMAQIGHAQHLLTMIDEVLQEAGCTIAELHGIVFGRGPGSFTGLRIACSVAKALAYPQNLPLYPVSTLAAIAVEAQKNHPRLPVLALIDARMQQCYWATFQASVPQKNSPPAIEEQLSDPAAIYLPPPGPYLLAGVGFESYITQFPLETQQQIQATEHTLPSTYAMITLTRQGKVSSVSAQEALPTYIRNNVTT